MSCCVLIIGVSGFVGKVFVCVLCVEGIVMVGFVCIVGIVLDVDVECVFDVSDFDGIDEWWM